MNTAPLELVVVAFRDERGAQEALQTLKGLKRDKVIGIVNAAVLVKDTSGKIHLKETADPDSKHGALFGAIVGGLLGLLGGPGGVVVGAAAGAATGGIAARQIDMGLPDEQLKDIAGSLQRGSSAIVAVIEHRWVADVLKELDEAAESVVRTQLTVEEIEAATAPEEGAAAGEGGAAG